MVVTGSAAGAVVWLLARELAQAPATPIGILFDAFVPALLGGVGAATAWVGIKLRNQSGQTAAVISGVSGLVVLISSGAFNTAINGVIGSVGWTMPAADVGRLVTWILFAPWTAPWAALQVAKTAMFCPTCNQLMGAQAMMVYEPAQAQKVVSAVERGDFASAAKLAVVKNAMHRRLHDLEGLVVRLRACPQCQSGIIDVWLCEVRRQPGAEPVTTQQMVFVRAATAEQGAALIAAAGPPPA
jgi:hypothetical protein